MIFERSLCHVDLSKPFEPEVNYSAEPLTDLENKGFALVWSQSKYNHNVLRTGYLIPVLVLGSASFLAACAHSVASILWPEYTTITAIGVVALTVWHFREAFILIMSKRRRAFWQAFSTYVLAIQDARKEPKTFAERQSNWAHRRRAIKVAIGLDIIDNFYKDKV